MLSMSVITIRQLNRMFMRKFNVSYVLKRSCVRFTWISGNSNFYDVLSLIVGLDLVNQDEIKSA